jgi:hypothetical protein
LGIQLRFLGLQGGEVMEQTTSSIVLTHERCEVHYASYPHVFVEDSDEAPAAFAVLGRDGVSIYMTKPAIPRYFSRKDGCSLKGWLVPKGECVLVASIGGKKPKEVRLSYKDGCVVEVKA